LGAGRFGADGLLGTARYWAQRGAMLLRRGRAFVGKIAILRYASGAPLVRSICGSKCSTRPPPAAAVTRNEAEAGFP
jgi:hypothetical protein